MACAEAGAGGADADHRPLAVAEPRDRRRGRRSGRACSTSRGELPVAARGRRSPGRVCEHVGELLQLGPADAAAHRDAALVRARTVAVARRRRRASACDRGGDAEAAARER